MYTYIPSLLNHSHPCRLSQSIELGFLCDTSVSLQLSILHMVVYLCHLSSQSIPPSPSHSVSMHPLCLRLYSGPGTRFICNAISESLMRWVSHISAACLTLTSSRRAVSGRSHSEFTNIFPAHEAELTCRLGALDLRMETQRNQILPGLQPMR